MGDPIDPTKELPKNGVRFQEKKWGEKKDKPEGTDAKMIERF